MNRKERRRLKKERNRAASGTRQQDTAARADALCAEGRFEAGLEIYRRLVVSTPQDDRLWCNLGNAALELGFVPEASEAYSRAIELNPDLTPALINLALLKSQTGERDAAISLYRRVLAQAPEDAETYFDLSKLKKFEPGDPDLAMMENLLARKADDRATRIHLGFALAKAHEDIGDFDGAFRDMLSANSAKRETLDFDIRAEERLVSRIIDVFSPEMLRQSKSAPGRTSPSIFIVGMPRSGTTLVEQILASHSMVYGGGELPALRDLVVGAGGNGLRGFGASNAFPEGVAELDGDSLEALARAYEERVRNLTPKVRRITDKMPRNFYFLGLIHLAMPDAKVIHCRRSPMDTCLSCFSIHFPRGQEFSYDLTELGEYYRQYARLMDHWRNLLGDWFFEVDYEKLVFDVEMEARRLLEFCGLDWEPGVLEFHKTDRQVATASSEQVRRPIYRSAVARWKRYGKGLAPLIEALGSLAHEEADR